MMVRCPCCGKRVPWESNPFRPFCSERCKLIDLGMWASEAYRIAGPSIGISAREQSEEEFAERGDEHGRY
ncbi:MAG: DNA gyrase inhibitor YacG [Blastocatellia bacterium]|nr:DNA gyrase inhibitor YacG [Blastocatellia bacterium]MCX7751814.1 DNA gyrase inhibitor YacG [Blastocatellia bacterium]